MDEPVHIAMRRWLFDAALPCWAANGVDRERGGFVEQLTPDGQDAGVEFKRTRVTCRQIYVFAHAYMMGWNPGKELAQHGLDYLTERTWIDDNSGFARKLARDGAIIDATPDLYDHAFVLFALAWHYRATGDSAARDWLYRTMDFIDDKLRHPDQGFHHALPPEGWRQQNPHMHLAEAALAAFDATGDSRFAFLARELAGLFQTRFFNTHTGTLAEYFDDGLRPAPGDAGRLTEPGHQFEWAWILNACRKTLGMDLSGEIRSAAAFAESHGVDPVSGATWNTIRNDGAPLDRGSRTWPNTERLKAAVALKELDGVDPGPVFEAAGGLLMRRYLGETRPGLWIDNYDEHGVARSQTVPASTFYHIFLAFSEVIRTSGQTAA